MKGRRGSSPGRVPRGDGWRDPGPLGVGTWALRTPSDRRSGTRDGMHVEKSGVNRKCHVCKSFEGFAKLPDRLGGRGREKQSLSLRRD